MRERLYNMPGDKSIRDQAADRGEPVPEGKTVAEVVAMGYVVANDVAQYATLNVDKGSPTGYVWEVHEAHLRRILDEERGSMEPRLLLWRSDTLVNGHHYYTTVNGVVLTIGWLRRHRLVGVSIWVPNWATIRNFTKNEHDFLVGVVLNEIPAVAPTAADFEEETERRDAAGLPPLKDWQRPSVAGQEWKQPVVKDHVVVELDEESGKDD